MNSYRPIINFLSICFVGGCTESFDTSDGASTVDYIVGPEGELLPMENCETTNKDEASGSGSSLQSTPSPRMSSTKCVTGKATALKSLFCSTESMLQRHAATRDSFWQAEFEKQRQWEEKQQKQLLDNQVQVINNAMKQFGDCIKCLNTGPFSNMPFYHTPFPHPSVIPHQLHSQFLQVQPSVTSQFNQNNEQRTEQQRTEQQCTEQQRTEQQHTDSKSTEENATPPPQE